MHITDRQRKLADALMQPGAVIKRAMMESGYSEQTSSHGLANVPNRVVKLMAKKGIRLKELGEIDAQTQEKLVRGRLVYNTIKGSDKGVLSAKALGSDKRIAMWAPDIQAGVIVLSVPTQLMPEKLLVEPED